jgi:superfamily II DNA or RNA helicase
MIVTSHVDESLDVPAIDTAFLTEGRKARRSRQRAGRSVRRGAGAKSLVVNLWDLDSSVMQSQSSGRCNALVNYYETKKYRFDALEDLISYIGNLQP